MDWLRDFIRALGGTPAARPRFDADDERLAIAALLIHCMSIDGKVRAEEDAKLRDLLARRFNLSGDALAQLIADATEAESEAVDLYRFTSLLKRQMPVEARIALVEELWEIVYADGASSEFEENLVWRVAELLAVDRQARLASRLAVSESKKTGADST
jgi:uncharacterized tellurite resistance protein B-like protein